MPATSSEQQRLLGNNNNNNHGVSRTCCGGGGGCLLCYYVAVYLVFHIKMKETKNARSIGILLTLTHSTCFTIFGSL